MSALPTLVLADDHEIVLHGLRALLAPRFEIIGVANDGLSLLDLATRLSPDVIVSDITLPGMNGIDALQAAKAKGSSACWIMLSMHADAAYVVRALKAGARGYVVKTSAGDELLSAIDAGRAGQTYVSAAVEGDYRAMLEKEKLGGRSAQITPRQTEVLRLLAKGLSAKEIASQLDISTRTAEAHKYQMMEALGFKTTAQLIHYAIKNGFV